MIMRVANTLSMMSTASDPKCYSIAIIGGGITGAVAAQTLVSNKSDINIHVDIYDQGRRGVGGRTSSRTFENDKLLMRWDHGCQFFRADTDQFKDIVKEWIENDFVREWKGQFISAIPDTGNNTSIDFFGLPFSRLDSQFPFFTLSSSLGSTLVSQFLESSKDVEMRGKTPN